jgi:hypothetical protein
MGQARCNYENPRSANAIQLAEFAPADGSSIWTFRTSDLQPYAILECATSRWLFDEQGNVYETGYPKGDPAAGPYLVSYTSNGTFRWASPTGLQHT